MPSNAAVTALVALFNATGGPTNWTRRGGWGHGDPCGGSNASNSNSNSNVPEQEQQPDPLDTDWYKYEEVKLLAANGVGGQQGQQWYGICCQDTAIDATGLPTCEGAQVGVITGINLQSNGLVGHLPSDPTVWASLSSLQSLILRTNTITGS
eukprot:gene15386-16556_t